MKLREAGQKMYYRKVTKDGDNEFYKGKKVSYIVMELVEGGELHDYLMESAIGFSEEVARFFFW